VHFVYILKLEGDRYYVGETSSLGTRIRQHFEGVGAYWTQTHRPTHVIFAMPVARSEARRIENITVQHLIELYGAERVCGGNHIVPTRPPSPARSHEPWSAEEEATVAGLYESGSGVRDIAHEVGRSVNAIRIRLERLGFVMP